MILASGAYWVSAGSYEKQSDECVAQAELEYLRTTTRRQEDMLAINLFNGLVYGALLIVMSSGLALIYGLRRVVKFAHGALYMLGAYIGFSVAVKVARRRYICRQAKIKCRKPLGRTIQIPIAVRWAEN